MSDSSIPEYILRKPYELPNGDKWIDVSWDDFDELFVPLDRQATQEQLETIFDGLIGSVSDAFSRRNELDDEDFTGINFWHEQEADAKYYAIAEVLVLFGLENTGGTIDAKALYLEGEKGQTNPGETNERS